MLRSLEREERTDTGYRIHRGSLLGDPFLATKSSFGGFGRGVHSYNERSPKMLYDPRSRTQRSPVLILVNNNPNPSLFEGKHELRRAIVSKIRIAAARTALDAPERMIPYRELRRLATEIGTLADPRTIDGYIQTLLDAEYFELTFDRENVILLQIPVELAYDAVAPRAKNVISEPLEPVKS